MKMRNVRTYEVRFLKQRDITKSSADGHTIVFPYSLRELPGPDGEGGQQGDCKVTVSISGTLEASWGLADADVIKAAFQIGQQKLKSEMQAGRVGEPVECVANGANSPVDCPFNPEEIPSPEGTVLKVLVQDRQP